MRYTFVAIVNLLFGSFQILLAFWQLFFVIPRLGQLYSEFGVDVSKNLTYAYLFIIFILVLGVAQLFLGIKNLSSSPSKEKYFKYGIILAVLTSLLFVATIRFLSASRLLPIYNLPSQF